MRKKRLSLSLLRIVAVTGVLFAVAGCAPTIRAVPEDVIESESLRTAREEGREEGRREGSRLCRQEMEERLRDFVRKYRDELLYLELVKGGAIIPAQVRLVYNPARISRDGSSYSAPTLGWKIVSPPRFVSDESGGDWLGRDRANFCYFLVDSFATEAEAFLFLGNSAKPDDVFLTMAPHGDGGKWAVIAKAFKTKCDGAMAFYRKLGRQAIRVE
jgi:hypothetical protein